MIWGYLYFRKPPYVSMFFSWKRMTCHWPIKSHKKTRKLDSRGGCRWATKMSPNLWGQHVQADGIFPQKLNEEVPKMAMIWSRSTLTFHLESPAFLSIQPLVFQEQSPCFCGWPMKGRVGWWNQTRLLRVVHWWKNMLLFLKGEMKKMFDLIYESQDFGKTRLIWYHVNSVDLIMI